MDMSHLFKLHRANPKTFAKCESIYGDLNGLRYLTATKEQRQAISLTGSDGKKDWLPYWICDENHVVGGVLRNRTAFCRLFFVPEYHARFEVCLWLANAFGGEGDKTGDTSFYDLMQEDVVYFKQLGFEAVKTRMGMWIEKEAWSYGCNLNALQTPQVNLTYEPPSIDCLVDLHVASFSKEIDAVIYRKTFQQEPTREVYKNELMDWVQQLNMGKTSGSIFATETENNQIIGNCLVGEEDGIATLYSVCVLPKWRRKGIGEAMVRAALSQRLRDEQRCQLYVTLGNPAVQLYEKIGFQKNAPFTYMKQR